MATDYISRDSALRAVVDAVELYPHEYDAITKEINFIHPADVRPVVRGRWEDETGYIFNQLAQRVYCPVCKSYAYFYPITTKNFCPNCGADMRPEGMTEK